MYMIHYLVSTDSTAIVNSISCSRGFAPIFLMQCDIKYELSMRTSREVKKLRRKETKKEKKLVSVHTNAVLRMVLKTSNCVLFYYFLVFLNDHHKHCFLG